MNKKSKIGMLISLIGIALMAYEMGKNAKTGESNLSLTYTGLFIVFVGILIFYIFNKK